MKAREVQSAPRMQERPRRQMRQAIPEESIDQQPAEKFRWSSFLRVDDDYSDVTPEVRAKILNWD